jgi:GT2 family glycosyltransferase
MIESVVHSTKAMPNTWLKADFVPGLVSVVVPLYNRAEYIVGTLDSVIVSTYRPIEILVVDDGSTDDSAAVVTKWIKQLPGSDRLKASLIEQPNSGPSTARNRGAMESRGEYIHFLDADDMVASVWYEYTVRTLKTHPECGLVWAGWKQAETPAMKEAIRWCMENDAIFSEGIIEKRVPPYFWAALFHRNTLELVGRQSTDVYPGEDTNYFLRVQMHGIPIRRLACTLIAYRQFPEQASRGRNWRTVDSLLRSIEQAERVQQELAMPAERQILIREKFADEFRTAIVWGLVGEHKDLVVRAGQGLKRYWAAFSVRHRMQIGLLMVLGGFGFFKMATVIGRRFYGAGTFETGARISK